MSRRRTLHPEETEIWLTVARTATPMHTPKTFAKIEDVLSAPIARPETPKLAPFQLGQSARKTSTAVQMPVVAPRFSASLRMDAKTHAKMTRGKLSPESRIDLHGMTVDQAHPALISFVLSAHAAGMRLVLVITGKGKARDDQGPNPARMGVLRKQVPNWLQLPPLAQVVLQVTESHSTHGGGGALYVYLRRR